MKKLFLSGLIASALVVPAVVYAAPETSTQPPVKAAPAKPGVNGPMHSKSHMMDPKMRLTKRLAAMETAIGIRSDQLDVWRKYTSSFVDMMSPMRSAQNADGAIPGERMADYVIQQAKKAETFKAAAASLRKALDKDQLRRLNELSRPQHHKMGKHGQQRPGHRPGQKQ